MLNFRKKKKIEKTVDIYVGPTYSQVLKDIWEVKKKVLACHKFNEFYPEDFTTQFYFL